MTQFRDLEQDFSHEDHQRTSTDEAIFLRFDEDSCKLVDSCVGTERDCWKIVIGIRCEYLSYRHLSWRILFLEAHNSWNVAILKLLWKFCFCFQDYHQCWKGRGGRRAYAVLVLWEAACVESTAVNCLNSCDQDCSYLTSTISNLRLVSRKFKISNSVDAAIWRV